MSAINELKAVLLNGNGGVSIKGSDEDRQIIAHALVEIERMLQMDMDDLITQITEDLDFDALEDWCAILSVDYELPPIDDMYPDWESELRTEIAEAMGKVGIKPKQKPLGIEMADCLDKILNPSKEPTHD